MLIVTKNKMQTTRNDQAKERQRGNEERGIGSKGEEARRGEQWGHGEGDEDQSTKDKVQWLAKAK